jgi:hypothetical protein
MLHDNINFLKLLPDQCTNNYHIVVQTVYSKFTKFTNTVIKSRNRVDFSNTCDTNIRRSKWYQIYDKKKRDISDSNVFLSEIYLAKCPLYSIFVKNSILFHIVPTWNYA